MKNIKIGIENFRVFNKMTEFELAPITVLTGENSSGKSSVLKALLLFKENTKEEFPFYEHLDFTAESHKLGNFEKTINNNTKKKYIKFRFDYNFKLFSRQNKNEMYIDLTYELNKDDNLKSAKLFQVQLKQSNNIVFSAYRDKYFQKVWKQNINIKFFKENLLKYYELKKEDEKEDDYQSYPFKEYFYNQKYDDIKIDENFVTIYPYIITKESVFKKEFNIFDILLSKEYNTSKEASSFSTFSIYKKHLLSIIKKELEISSLKELIQTINEEEIYLLSNPIISEFMYFDELTDRKYFYLYGYTNFIFNNPLNEIISFNVKNKDLFKLSITVLKKELEKEQKKYFFKNNSHTIKKIIKLKSISNYKKHFNQLTSLKLPKIISAEEKALKIFKESIYDFIESNVFNSKDNIETNQEMKKNAKSLFDLSISRITFNKKNYFIEKFLIKYLSKNLKESFKFVKNFEYLEAVRANTQRLYTFKSQGTSFNKLIRDFEKIGFKNDDKEIKFLKKWLEKFEINNDLIIKVNDNGIGISIELGKDNLADLGYGITQFLPILFKIVVIANANKVFENKPIEFSREYLYERSTLYIEEPETNLHPKLQSFLADLFVDAYKNFSIHFVLETHSEYLIRKLQFLTAKKTIKPENISIYYLYNPKRIPTGEEQVKKLSIDENGFMKDNFGTGFFDEASKLITDIWKIDNRN